MKLSDRINGRTVVLEPLAPPHYPAVYALSNRCDTSYRWRSHGRTLGPEEFEAQLWPGSIVQFAVRPLPDQEVKGLTVVYNHSGDHGFAHFAQLTEPSEGLRRWPIEATALTFEYALSRFAIRKLYLHVPGYNLDQFARAVGTVFEEEGRLEDHFYFDRRYWPLHILTLDAASWLEQRHHFLGALDDG